MIFIPYSFLKSLFKGLKFKYCAKSLVASKWHDPRYDSLSDFPLASRNTQLAGLRLGDLAIVVLSHQKRQGDPK